jgi:response regulator of citrate/malate metabolism
MGKQEEEFLDNLYNFFEKKRGKENALSAFKKYTVSMVSNGDIDQDTVDQYIEVKDIDNDPELSNIVKKFTDYSKKAKTKIQPTPSSNTYSDPCGSSGRHTNRSSC